MADCKALVVCVGNSLVGDDAAGCAVFERLESEGLPEGARLHLLGIGGISLLDCLAGERVLIIVDAVQFGSAPGTIHVLAWDDVPQASAGAVSAHGIGLHEAIAIGRILTPEAMPEEIVLVGIEGVSFDDLGSGMTREVAAAVEAGAREVRRQIALRLAD